MNKIMESALKEWGIEVGQKFKITNNDNELLNFMVHINNKGDLVNEFGTVDNAVLGYLIIGYYKIIKPTFKPERLQTYWCVDFNSNSLKTISYQWYDFPTDYINYSFGNCFRTEEEITEEIKQEIIKQIKEKYESEQNNH